MKKEVPETRVQLVYHQFWPEYCDNPDPFKGPFKFDGSPWTKGSFQSRKDVESIEF